ncbi:unnamed protein product, partial [marine sediment metagenome]
TIKNATGYFLSGALSIQSATAAQTPTFFINSSTITTDCYSKKERTLKSNDEIGSVYLNTICQGLTVGATETFYLGVTVATGKTLIIYDDMFNGFEVNEFDITSLAPPASSVNVSQNGTVTNSSTWDYGSMLNFSASVNSTYEVDLCNFSINGSYLTIENGTNLGNTTNSSGVNYTFVNNTDGGMYWWNVTCMDTLGAEGISPNTWNFTIEAHVSPE